uniref:Uncharacterized protein n=1 Tax=Rhipicephalus zambeziensis TaxID=60191 RepID=A0A224YFN1_9ACAR
MQTLLQSNCGKIVIDFKPRVWAQFATRGTIGVFLSALKPCNTWMFCWELVSQELHCQGNIQKLWSSEILPSWVIECINWNEAEHKPVHVFSINVLVEY